jgi:uncharacterized protein (TIGR02246 family)
MTTARFIASTLLAASFFPVLAIKADGHAQAPDVAATVETAAKDIQAIHDVLGRYEKALNASDTNAVIPLYAEDGVFMPAFSPSAVGAPAVRRAYDAVFNAIRLEVTFDIVEIVQVAPTWAFARTNSAGTVTINATGARNAEANQELFVFHRGDDGAWKIARYSFSPTNPPRG